MLCGCLPWAPKGCSSGAPGPNALAVHGREGVARLFSIFEAEMRLAIAMTGVTGGGAIDRTLLV